MTNIFDFLLHADKYLTIIISNYGYWVYGVLFIIIFLETGLVVTPFLPGDSLLFIAGTFAAVKLINIWVLLILLSIAAIAGDSLNYAIGSFLGPRIFKKETGIFFRKDYLIKTEKFYEKHGAKTIVLARFIPIIRTFAPLIAGVGRMKYSKFFAYNIIGGILWVAIFLFAGYLFGNIPFVKDNLTLIVIAIIVVSAIPVIIEFLKQKFFKHKK